MYSNAVKIYYVSSWFKINVCFDKKKLIQYNILCINTYSYWLLIRPLPLEYQLIR